MQYQNEQKQFKVPFIMYANFESILELMERKEKEDNKNRAYAE